MLETYLGEVFHFLGFKEAPSERSLYRTVEVVGKGLPLLLERYQLILQEHGLVDREENFNILATTWRVTKLAEEQRYSRTSVLTGSRLPYHGDKRGALLRCAAGQCQEKRHFCYLLNVAKRVLEKGSLQPEKLELFPSLQLTP